MKILAPLLACVFLLPAAAAHAAAMPQLADLVARVMPAVVSIASTDPVTGDGDQNDDGGSEGSAYHPTADSSGTLLPPPKAMEALGSGFVFDPSGYILTNAHVINGAATVTVTFQDGTILPAVIVGRDKGADLAVLKVDAGHKLPFVSFGDSGKLRVGDWVVAIGNPYGLPGSTSAGIVSALDRNISQDSFDDFIQTDATINRGNSGGPMFNIQGQVVGVNSDYYSPSGGSVGIGFAIPSAMVAPVALSLEHNGSMTRGWLGIATQEVTPAVQASLGLPDSAGALVGGVSPDGPSVNKLQPGDVLVGIDGTPIKNPRALFIRVAEIPAGQSVPVTFWRDGAQMQASVVVTVPPAAPGRTVAQPAPAAPGNVNLASLGLAVSAKPTDGGVAVTSADGPSAQAGIVAGDMIEQVAGQTVATAAALKSQVQALKQQHAPVAVLLVSGDTGDGSDPGPRWVPVMFQAKK
jgi:serine protease Do/2-alkenal reductase